MHIHSFFIYTCLCSKTKFLLHNIIVSRNIWDQKRGFSLTGTTYFLTADRNELPLVYCHFMAQSHSFLHRSSEKLSLSKNILYFGHSLKSETGRERFAPTDAAERSDPRVALPRSLAFCDIFKKRFVPVFGSVLELILIRLRYQVSRTQTGMGEVRLLPVVSISHSQIDSNAQSTGTRSGM